MSLYEQDFYQWTQEQAALLKAGALSQIDIENLIEEVEDMGKSQKKRIVKPSGCFDRPSVKMRLSAGTHGKKLGVDHQGTTTENP